MPVKKSKPKKVSKYTKEQNAVKRQVIERCLKKDRAIAWPRETMVMNKLFDRCGDIVFWNSIDLKFDLNSVAWFLTDDGKKFLRDQYALFTLTEEQKLEAESLKVVAPEAIISERKSPTVKPPARKSLADFLGIKNRK